MIASRIETLAEARARIWAGVPRRTVGTEVVLLSVFGDESADEKAVRVFATAGVVGRELDWQGAEAEWLQRTGGKIFHASDCERDPGGKELYKDLTQILAKSRLSGYGVALDLVVYRKFFGGMRQDFGYYKTFMYLLRFLTERAQTLGMPIEFTFHGRKASEHNTYTLYELLANTPDWTANIYMSGKLSFDSQENPRIQMADLFARETMKSMDNQFGPTRRKQRESTTALCSAGFRIDWLRDDYCSGWRQSFENSKILDYYTTWISG